MYFTCASEYDMYTVLHCSTNEEFGVILLLATETVIICGAKNQSHFWSEKDLCLVSFKNYDLDSKATTTELQLQYTSQVAGEKLTEILAFVLFSCICDQIVRAFVMVTS